MNQLYDTVSRRSFVTNGISAAAALLITGSLNQLFSQQSSHSKLKTRGVVLSVDDLLTLDWPRLAHDAGLTTIGTHVTPSQVKKFIESDKGLQFVENCKKYNIQVEHELHAMRDLLPRDLFSKDPEMFRMNEDGRRVADYNCCPHSSNGLEIISSNAVKYSQILRSATGRYFYWLDDAAPMCRCNLCRDLSDSDQALLVENAIIKALRREISGATLAHLAYANTKEPPANIKPEEGIFLEFAPIHRSWSEALTNTKAGVEVKEQGRDEFHSHGKVIDLLHANLRIFPASTAQVLEYWLDVSLQSQWKKPARKITWYPEVCRKDVAVYAKAGISNITTFAVYVDGSYKAAYKDLSFIREYGKILNASS